MKNISTEQWAQCYGISNAVVLPPIADYEEPCPLSARQIATRAIVLQGIIAAACQVDPEPIIEWVQVHGIWNDVTPREQAFLLNPGAAGADDIQKFRWQQEAEWTLLWVLGKVEQLGLPTNQCDTRRMVDEIIPELGSDIEPFLASVTLRQPGELLAEDDRHYDLWCRYFQTRRENPASLPSDLILPVLYQRVYAFVWLHGIEEWDDVQCDA